MSATELIELRQYRLHPGQRDTLIDVFDREFVETQEAVGMAVLGQFRDPRRPDHFVWLRGFPDMASRHESLTAFYDGPVWAKHRDVANATMIDFDNVLLLRAAADEDRLAAPQPNRRDNQQPRPLVGIVVDYVERVNSAAIERFRSEVLPTLTQRGCCTLGLYATEAQPNTFARLPVRTDQAIVWIGGLTGDGSVLDVDAPTHGRRQDRHVLMPTPRSALDGTTPH